MIAKFGGHEELANALGVNVVQVYRWTYPKDRKGTDGRIPDRHFRTLLQVAKQRGIKINRADLVSAE
jgi:hypothetical protein